MADQVAGGGQGFGEDQGAEAQGGVGADLGHHGEQGGDDPRRVGIGAGKPELQRHQRALDREDQDQHDGGHAEQRGVTLGQERQLCRKVGHVERAGDPIKQRQGKEEQGRADKVEGDVLDARAGARLAPAVDHQPVGGDQEDLEEDEEVEGVAGQEGPGNAHQKEHEKRVEMRALAVPARADGVKRDGEREDRKKRDHQRRQPVKDQHDAERGGPVAEEIGLRPIGGGKEKGQRDGVQRKDRGKAGDALQREVAAQGDDHHGRDQGGQDDGGDDPVAHPGTPARVGAVFRLSAGAQAFCLASGASANRRGRRALGGDIWANVKRRGRWVISGPPRPRQGRCGRGRLAGARRWP